MLGLLSRTRKSWWAGYIIALLACALSWGLHLVLVAAGATNAPFLPFFLAIAGTAMFGGIGPGLVALAFAEFLAGGFGGHFYAASGLATGNAVATAAVLFVGLVAVLLANYGASTSIKLEQATLALKSINETLEARITERTAALLDAEENLRQANKMEAIGQLTGGIAHDFNNLLTSILGSLERLQSSLPHAGPEALTSYISTARDAATRAANLTHRLLAFARRQPLCPRGTNIDDLVAGMAALISQTISPAINVEIKHGPGPHNIMVDPNQLEHALLNLCINASDAMPDGGILTITSGHIMLCGTKAKRLGLAPGDYVTLTVADTGTGMTPEILARAFDPFFTTKPPGQGTGLGLSMIYGFARQSGGHTEVVSAPGAGTRVTLYLPLHEGAVESLPCTPALLPAPPAGIGERILLVDDEASIRQLAAEVLQEQGYSVHQAENAEDALRILRDSVAMQMLITDLGLPGLSGRALADAARTLHPSLKILLITGYGEQPATPGSDAAVLSKPFPMSVLAARVQEMLTV